MEMKEAEQLLQRYFNGETTEKEEERLTAWFQRGEADDALKPYAAYFKGIQELTDAAGDESIEAEVMDYILENESKEKSKYRWLWKTVTGIAASVILVIGGMLLYQQPDKTYEDTFENPEMAYVHAENALMYVSSKYNKGVAELNKFDKLNRAAQPLKKGMEPVNAFYENVEQMSSISATSDQ
jgi:hypothetical protein